MEADKEFKPERDYKGFEITVKVLNHEYLADKEDKTTNTDTFYGGGYFLAITEEDGVQTAKHGYIKPRTFVRSVAQVVSEESALPLLLAVTLEMILDEGTLDAAMKFLQEEAHLNGWGTVWQIT